MTADEVKQKADTERQSVKDLLQRMFPQYTRQDTSRIVDAIVNVAVLEVAWMQAEAFKRT